MKAALVLIALLTGAGAAAAQLAPAPETPMMSDAFLSEAARNYFKMLDTDGDGRISRDEYIAPLMRQFRNADASGDDFLSLEELSVAVRTAMMSGMARSQKRTEGQ